MRTEKTGGLVKTILDSMSFISPDEIPENLLQEIFSNGSGLIVFFRPFGRTGRSLGQMFVRQLTAYDLLKYDRNKKTFTTHRAIQRVIQSRLKGNEKDICIALAPVLEGLFPRIRLFEPRGVREILPARSCLA